MANPMSAVTVAASWRASAMPDVSDLEGIEEGQVAGHQFAGMDIWHLEDGTKATICAGTTLTAETNGELVEQYGLQMQASRAGDGDE